MARDSVRPIDRTGRLPRRMTLATEALVASRVSGLSPKRVAMCGIAGYAGPDAASHARSVERIAAHLSHRGPDASGQMIFDGCVLSHRRLRIIDLTPNGDQ